MLKPSSGFVSSPDTPLPRGSAPDTLSPKDLAPSDLAPSCAAPGGVTPISNGSPPGGSSPKGSASSEPISCGSVPNILAPCGSSPCGSIPKISSKSLAKSGRCRVVRAATARSQFRRVWVLVGACNRAITRVTAVGENRLSPVPIPVPTSSLATKHDLPQQNFSCQLFLAYPSQIHLRPQ